MPASRIWPILILAFLCHSCVEPFEPELNSSQKVMVISGMITDQPGRHTVNISLSSPYQLPEIDPVEQCIVSAENGSGELVYYSDMGAGLYVADVPDDFLSVGDAVRLQVVTKTNRLYLSEYDTILPCPALDSVYWELDSLETAEPDMRRPGIRFYLDMSGTPNESRDLLWQTEESWEYHASLFSTSIIEEGWVGREYRNYGIYKCWKHLPLAQFYVASTRNLVQNNISRMPLHFVSNETDRLGVTYSLLVRQQSLTADAYDYFRRKHEQALENGGLYGTQPASVEGNICSEYVADEIVLGYFHATQLREKRIFVHNNNFFDFDIPVISCEYLPMSAIWEWEYIDFPVYTYTPGPFQPSYTGYPECFDCRLQGGDTIRPPHWESWQD